ncbi:MAG: hypothetical protein ACYS0D_15930, partial [Planctomycetota bacterium]
MTRISPGMDAGQYPQGPPSGVETGCRAIDKDKMTKASRQPALSLFLVTVASAALLLAGCSSYVLQGRVVHGDVSDMAFVHADDPRLAQSGLSSVRI